MIRRMESADVARVVAIHRESFPGFFLSFLGPRFLSLYYAGICGVPEGIAFVSLGNSGLPEGFVAGSSNPQGFYSRLLKSDWLKFAAASLGALVRKPMIISRLMRALFHPSKNPVGGDVAGLFSIGVLPSMQGSGAGKELVHAFLNEAAHRGCARVFLTTDRDGNDSVNGFYKKLGFRIERQFVTPEGRRMNEYWIDVAGNQTK